MSYRTMLYVSAAILGTSLISSAYADDQAIEQVVVTARRVEERMQDVPISITLFNQSQLDSRNITTAADLGTYTPSLSLDKRYGADTATFAIRGFTEEVRTTASVGVYFDDVVAPRGGGGVVLGGDGAGPGDFFDLQNVQVLKGPQGTLFGRNTTGGAVLLVPQKPTSQLEGYFEGSAGNYGMFREQGVINIPIDDKVRFRLGVDHMTRDGYLQNVGVGPKAFGDVNYVAVRAGLDVDVAPSVENYTLARFTNSQNHGTPDQAYLCSPTAGTLGTELDAIFPKLGAGALVSGMCAAEVNRIKSTGNYWTVDSGIPNPISTLQQWQVINTTTWAATDELTVKNIAAYAQYRNSVRLPFFGDDLVIPPGFPGAGLHEIFTGYGPIPGYDSNDQATMSEELQFQGNTNESKLIYQGGVYFELSEPLGTSTNRTANVAACSNIATLDCIDLLGDLLYQNEGFYFPIGTVADEYSRVIYHNFGVYGQETWSITDQLKWTAGARYTSDVTEGANNAFEVEFPPPSNTPTPACLLPTAVGGTQEPNGCYTTERQKSQRPSWVTDLDYTPIEDEMVYAKYARGYRQGSVINGAPPGFSTYGPELVDSYEVGSKSTFASDIRGIFDTALFWNDFHHQQLEVGFQSGGESTNAIENLGHSRIFGAEIDSSIQPLERVRFDFDGTWLDTRILKFSEPTAPAGWTVLPTAVQGDTLPYSPKYKLTMTGTYTLPLPSEIGKVSLAATYVHTTRMLTGVVTFSSTYPSSNNGASSDPQDLLNLNLNWNAVMGSAFDFSVFCTNATNLQYATFRQGIYNAYGYEARALGEPRMIGVTLRYNFDGQ